MAVRINKGNALSSLTLTPLIDVVFLLLVFFLVTTRFAQEDYELDVVLPSASEAQPLIAEPRELFVNIDRQGDYVVDGRLMTRQEVEEVLRQAVANNPVHQSVIIRADKRVAFDYVVAIMDLCNRAGVRDYSVTTARSSAWPRCGVLRARRDRGGSDRPMNSCGRWSWRSVCWVVFSLVRC